MWLEKIFGLKYVGILISTILMLVGLTGIVLGIRYAYHGVLILIGQEEGKVGVHLIESIDTLLFSVVVLILAAGIFKLFAGNKDTFKRSQVLYKIKDFKELKILLWETLLLTLTVWSSLSFFLDPINLRLEQLILPGSILLLALSLYLIKGKNQSSKSD